MIACFSVTTQTRVQRFSIRMHYASRQTMEGDSGRLQRSIPGITTWLSGLQLSIAMPTTGWWVVVGSCCQSLWLLLKPQSHASRQVMTPVNHRNWKWNCGKLMQSRNVRPLAFKIKVAPFDFLKLLLLFFCSSSSRTNSTYDFYFNFLQC